MVKNLESVLFVKNMYKRLGYEDVEKMNVFFHMIIVTLFILFCKINILKYFICNEKYTSYNTTSLSLYEFINQEYYNIFKYSLGSICISTLIIYTLNRLFVIDKIWTFLFIKDYPHKFISSSEKRCENKFIKYPINTYSSSFILLIGSYLILRSDSVYNQYTTFCLGWIINIMGIFSILWWATGKKVIRKFDNLFMEIHGLYLSISYISLIDVEYTFYLNLLTLLFIMIRFYYIENARVVCVLILEKITGLYICVKLNNVGNEILFYLSSLCIMMGFYYKIKDHIFKFKYGTGVFHILAPLSILLQYEWSQSLLYN